MNWKDKFIINIQKQRNLVCNSQTIYDDETINKEINFEELVKDQTLIVQYVKNATDEQIAELIEKHGLELVNISLMRLLKTARPLLIVTQHNPRLVKEIFDKNPNLRSRFKGVYERLAENEKDLPNKVKDLELLRREELTYGACLNAVQQNGKALCYVPIGLRTEEMCLAAVQENGNAIYDVPLKLRTSDLCWAAVKQKGYALRYVPLMLKTPEMCLAAVQQNGRVLEYVPQEMRTEELCLAAVKQNGRAIQNVPEELKTPEICLAAIQQDGFVLYYLPYESRTEDLCWAAVRQNGHALEYVPEEFMTSELCLAAVQQNGLVLGHIAKNNRTYDLCLAAVQQDGNALFSIPKELRTPEICLAAVKQNSYALRYVPDDLRTPDLCLIAIQQNGFAMNYVPKELRTPELYLTAVELDGDALGRVPEELRTPSLCLAAVKQNGKALRNVPEKLRTPEIYFATIKNIVPDSCKAFYKYFIIQMKEGISTFHDFENSFFTTKELLSKQNSQKYHWDSFFGKFSSNNAMELYKLFNKKKDLVDYQVDKIENIDVLSSDGINKLYSTYIFPIKQAELLKNAPEEMYDYLKTVEYLLDEGKTNADELIEQFEHVPAKSEIKEKHEVLKHRIMEINGFKFEILDRADETGLILGNLTGCCQKLGGGNSDAVYDGLINPKSNFLAIYYKDRLIAQSWLRLGKFREDPVTNEMKAVLYLDNIESNVPFSVNYEENFNKEKYELLKASFIEFAQTMKREYKLLNVIAGERYSDVVFKELLLDTPTVKEDFVGEEKLKTDLLDSKNFVIAKKLNDTTTFKTNITKIAKGKRKL